MIAFALVFSFLWWVGTLIFAFWWAERRYREGYSEGQQDACNWFLDCTMDSTLRNHVGNCES